MVRYTIHFYSWVYKEFIFLQMGTEKKSTYLHLGILKNLKKIVSYIEKNFIYTFWYIKEIYIFPVRHIKKSNYNGLLYKIFYLYN